MKPRFATTTTAIIAMASQIVYAQGVLEEIVVTARKKSENLQDVPISILVTTGEEIRKQGFRDLQAFTGEMPAVNLNKAGASAFVNVRGVGSGENPGFEQSVGFIVDNVPIGRSRATRGGLFDLERIEVLKGPQTTYFGANTIAGVINITTKAPSLEDGFDGYVFASYEAETEEKVIEAAVNLPIADTFALRLAGKVTDSDGWIDDVGLGKTVPAEEDKLFRATALWAPTDNFSAKLKLQNVVTEANVGLDLQSVSCVPGTPAAPNNATNDCIGADGNFVETNLDDQFATDFPGGFRKLDMDSAALNMELALGDYTLVSSSSWYEFENEFLYDLDGTNVPLATDITPSRFSVNQLDFADGLSQELRISSPQDRAFFWEAGVYYQEEDVLFSNVAVPGFAPPFVAFGGFQNGAINAQESETTSVFGSASVEITDRLTITAGVRYIEVEKTIRQTADTIGIFQADGIPSARNHMPRFAPDFVFETATRKDDDVIPSLEVSFAVSDDINTYVSYREGFKAGGYSLANPPLGVTSDFIQAFDPETVDAFELGAKGSFLDGRLNVNAAIFRMEYEDRQVSTLAASNSLTQNVGNAATSTSQGLEVDFVAQVSEQFSLKGAFSFLDSQFDSFPTAPCYNGQTEALGCMGGRQDLSGHVTTFAPDFSGSLTASYDVNLGDMVLTIEPNVYYTDDYFTISNFYPESEQSGFAKFNLRIALAPESAQWEVALVGRNLNDKTVRSWCQGAPATPGSVFCSPQRPATYALQGRYNF